MFDFCKFCAVFWIVVILASSKISSSSNLFTLDITQVDENYIIFKPVIERLLEQKVDHKFINYIITNNNLKFNEKFIRINVNNFISKPDYSFNWNQSSINRSINYLNENLAILNLANIKYNIPKEIVASIIYIETKNGTVLGKNNIVSVFFNTALCNEDNFKEMNKNNLKTNDLDSAQIANLFKKIDERSIRKSNWAFDQIMALYEIYKKNKKNITEINGSWAGAFGISQFLPSSYIKWGIDGNNDGKIDLFNHQDAIFSVANYLKSNGWDDNYENQRKAVFHYNNSNDYVDAVFRLSDSIRYYSSIIDSTKK